MLNELIAMAESSNNQSAIRYEPGYINRLMVSPEEYVIVAAAMAANACNKFSAQVLCSASYGLYQIMGESIYRLGYKKSIFDYVQSASDQTDIFNDFIRSRGIAYTLDEIVNDQTKRENFAHHYNGDIVAYSQHLLDTYNRMVG